MMTKGAVVKGDRRYQLWRIWDNKQPLLLYILLNPSNANAVLDDRTVSKLVRISKELDYGGFYLGNLHSFVTPYPSVLKDNIIKDDPLNLVHLKKMIEKCERIVLGWGNSGDKPQWLGKIVKQTFCFGLNQNRSPKHPLYLPYNSQLIPFE
jgi:hypothetical protein